MLFVDYDIKPLEKAVSSQAEEIESLSRKNSLLKSEIDKLKDQLAKGGTGGERPVVATPIDLRPNPAGPSGAGSDIRVAIPVQPNTPRSNPPIKTDASKVNGPVGLEIFFMDNHLRYCPAQYAVGY